MGAGSEHPSLAHATAEEAPIGDLKPIATCPGLARMCSPLISPASREGQPPRSNTRPDRDSWEMPAKPCVPWQDPPLLPWSCPTTSIPPSTAQGFEGSAEWPAHHSTEGQFERWSMPGAE